MERPCEWPVNYGACTDLTTFTEAELEVQELAEALAVEHLWRWTNKQFGRCPQVLRPCPHPVDPPRNWHNGSVGHSGLPWKPVIIDGKWYNLTSCWSCENPAATLVLPAATSSVTRVVIDGVDLPDTSWRFEGGVLRRTDGGAWPRRQNLHQEPETPGTWEVHIMYGNPVPKGGEVAAGVLANEFAKAMCQDDTCALPANVTSVVRQGISMELDGGDWEEAQEGRTNLWLVDSWVLSITSAKRPSTVLSPDTMKRGLRVR